MNDLLPIWRMKTLFKNRNENTLFCRVCCSYLFQLQFKFPDHSSSGCPGAKACDRCQPVTLPISNASIILSRPQIPILCYLRFAVGYLLIPKERRLHCAGRKFPWADEITRWNGLSYHIAWSVRWLSFKRSAFANQTCDDKHDDTRMEQYTIAGRNWANTV